MLIPYLDKCVQLAHPFVQVLSNTSLKGCDQTHLLEHVSCLSEPNPTYLPCVCSLFDKLYFGKESKTSISRQFYFNY